MKLINFQFNLNILPVTPNFFVGDGSVSGVRENRH